MSLNVLVAESSPQSRKNIIQSLQEIGVRNVTEASDGPDAIRQYKEAQFDVLFVDWNLKGQQGQNLVQEIRQINRDVPIIATVPSCPARGWRWTAAAVRWTAPNTTLEAKAAAQKFQLARRWSWRNR